MRKNLLFYFLVLFSLSACAEAELAAHVAKQVAPTPKSEGTFKVGNPYRVSGKLYRPQETYNFTETGIASWYGPGFHGKQTANGEFFDQNELTAAHRTLQMPSLVRVTNLENGRSLVVRINDRGPFKRGRVIDLSKRAAELLDFRHKGTAKVRVDLLTRESQAIADAARRGADTSGVEVAMNEQNRLVLTPPATKHPAQPQMVQVASTAGVSPLQPNAPVLPARPDKIPGHLKNGNFLPDPVVQNLPVTPSNIYVQAGAFSQAQNAHKLAARLQNYGQSHAYPVMVEGQRLHRVRIGPLPNIPAADQVLARMVRDGHASALIVVD